MDGLTAKVFRTYNASMTLQDQLDKLTESEDNVNAKVLSYNRANRAVAILCNHQVYTSKQYLLVVDFSCSCDLVAGERIGVMHKNQLANNRQRRQHNESMRSQSKYTSPAPRAGKCTWPSCDRFSSRSWLVGKVVPLLIMAGNKAKPKFIPDYFRQLVEKRSMCFSIWKHFGNLLCFLCF